MARDLTTDWMSIATSGPTVDGRNIEKKWLQDMAENYSEGLYSAKLWPDHYRYSGAWGKIVSLKVVDATEEKLKGEIHLMAKMAPNDELVYLNRRGKYTHCSIEVEKNFMGKGFFYLGGLGVTDEPASAGTSELHFSNRDSLRLPSVAFTINDDRDNQEERSFFAKLKNLLNNEKGESQDTAMDNNQFNQMMTAQNKTAQLLETLVGKFTSNKTGADDDQQADEEKPDADGKGKFVSQKDYDTLTEKFNALETKFNALSETEVPGTRTQENTGEADTCI